MDGIEKHRDTQQYVFSYMTSLKTKTMKWKKDGLKIEAIQMNKCRKNEDRRIGEENRG